MIACGAIMRALLRLMLVAALLFAPLTAGADVAVPPLKARVTDLTGTLTAANKSYDGTAAASATCAIDSEDVVGEEQVTCQVDSASFGDSAVGNGKTVTASVSPAGADSGNYEIGTGTLTGTANIAKKIIRRAP